MSEYESLGGGGSPSSSQPSTPSHTAAWLRRQFSSGGGGGADLNSNKESAEREDHWPDLLVDRRPIQERRGQVGEKECSAVERNNLVAVAALVVRAVVEASLRFGKYPEPAEYFIICLLTKPMT